MRMALICSAIGLLVGVGFAVLLALTIRWNQPIESPEAWLEREVLGSLVADAGQNPWIITRRRPVEGSPTPSLSAHLFLAILLGGGFGAVVGVVAGATSAIGRAIRETRPLPELSEHSEEVVS